MTAVSRRTFLKASAVPELSALRGLAQDREPGFVRLNARVATMDLRRPFLANRTRYGLAAYVWTNNLRAAMRAAERLEFGMVESRLSKESGAEGLDEYLETRLIASGGMA